MYCEAADVYDFGVPRGSIPNAGRLVSSTSAGTDAFELDEHGFADDDPVIFRAEASGSLPSPIVAGTTYYALVLDAHRFAVAAVAGGVAIDLTTAGSRVLVLAPLPIDAAISWASRVIDDMLPAHVVPLTAPYPEIVRMTCAELAAGKLAARSGTTSSSLASILEGAMKRVERWARTIPIRGTNAPKSAGLACAVAVATRDPGGWRRWGGL